MASLHGLECPHARWMVEELAVWVVGHPDYAPPVDGTRIRVLETAGYAPFPAVRLVYSFNDAAVFLLHFELYDPFVALDVPERKRPC